MSNCRPNLNLPTRLFRRFGIGPATGAAMCLLLTAPAIPGAEGFAERPLFPLKVSGNRRHLVDQRGAPFFYQAEYVLEVLSRLTPAEAIEYLDIRRRQGFTVIRAFLQPPGVLSTNRQGSLGFDPPGDLARPVDAWFAHAVWFAKEAEKRGMLVAYDSLFFGCCAQNEHYWLPYLTLGKARGYGRFLGERFRDCPNILWLHGGDQDPAEWFPQVRELLAGLKQTGSPHLNAYHPACNTARMFGSHGRCLRDESWVDLNCVFVHRVSYPEHHRDWNESPPKPSILSEAQFEMDSWLGYTPLRLRQQIYWSYLGGSCGHTYGHAEVWNFGENWRKRMESAGVRELRHAQTVLRDRWHKLMPDQQEQLVMAGAGFYGSQDYALAAMSDDRSFAVIYVPPKRSRLTLNLSLFNTAAVQACWFNPRDGSSKSPIRLSPSPAQEMSVPDPEDWVLLLEGTQ